MPNRSGEEPKLPSTAQALEGGVALCQLAARQTRAAILHELSEWRRDLRAEGRLNETGILITVESDLEGLGLLLWVTRQLHSAGALGDRLLRFLSGTRHTAVTAALYAKPQAWVRGRRALVTLGASHSQAAVLAAVRLLTPPESHRVGAVPRKALVRLGARADLVLVEVPYYAGLSPTALRRMLRAVWPMVRQRQGRIRWSRGRQRAQDKRVVCWAWLDLAGFSHDDIAQADGRPGSVTMQTVQAAIERFWRRRGVQYAELRKEVKLKRHPRGSA